jgi:hypothetical protein
MTQSPLKPFHALLLSAVLLVGGCTTYYQIRDPESGLVYYADDLDTLKGGAVKFRDARTGNEVTVQDSDIKEIPEEEFNIRRYQQVPAQAPAEEAK